MMLRSSLERILRSKVHTSLALPLPCAARSLGMTVRWYSEKAFEPTITFEELQRRIAEGKPDSVGLYKPIESEEIKY